MLDISGLDKAAVLTALFNRSKQQGLGFMHFEGRASMTVEDAREVLKTQQHFDYLRGRVMKISLHRDDVETYGYNRDNGAGAAENAVAELRALTGQAA